MAHKQTMIKLPSAPSVIATAHGAVWLSEDGEVEALSGEALSARLPAGKADGVMPYVCHARATARRLNIQPFAALDVLELFAFVRPATFCLPTPGGLAQALDLALPTTHEDEAVILSQCAGTLLGQLARANTIAERTSTAIAWAMADAGWVWGETVLDALAKGWGDVGLPEPRNKLSGLKVWSQLPEWEDGAPEPPPENRPVEAVEARARLVQLLGSTSEKRTRQSDYTAQASHAFAPREKIQQPHVVIAEAGTGIGKTLAYIAPASVWAEKNRGTVWLSTYTRNLQRQLDGELDRLYPLPDEKAARVVIRKGRENYLCLLNFEEAIARAPTLNIPGLSHPAVHLGLLARWLLVCRDGDMIGGDFPAWLVNLLGRSQTLELTDTRGECTYSACSHYKKCFIEHSQRRARRADIVVANHALVMVHAAMGGAENAADGSMPTRYVFDEGHHLFDAADSAFAAHLSGFETADLRRWLIGAEASSRSRSRGLRTRLSDLIAGDDKAEAALDEVIRAVHGLASPGWRQRQAADNPKGATEAFLGKVRQQVYARNENSGNAYGLETDTRPAIDGLLKAASDLETALERLTSPLKTLVGCLSSIMDQDADSLDSATRVRIEAVARGIERRALMPLAAWRDMAASLHHETPKAFVDWFSVERRAGNDADIGMFRHWIDPTLPFVETVVEPAHGVLITSATMRDGDDWDSAIIRSGASHLGSPAILENFDSPFDYHTATKVLIVTDVRKSDVQQVAAAYRTLFTASNGGALGLFTAINRLRMVHGRIAADLDKAGIEVLAQHVDPLDIGTLVDIFRAGQDTCLLGTDAVRDGIDVPGRSLRLIVFDRVPWPRPTILHRARRNHFGGRQHDEMLCRLRLKQAYGRLIRRASDRGIFIMLDGAMPSRLLNAFPEGVEITRTGLAEAADITRQFLTENHDTD